MEHEEDGYTSYKWGTWNNSQRIDKRSRRLGNKRTSGDHPDDGLIEIGQNTEKSPGDLRRFAVIQTPVRNLRLTMA